LRFWDRSVPQSHKRRHNIQRDVQPNHNPRITYVDRRAGTGFGYQFGVATYTGTVESPTKMTGAVEFTGATRGKWTATKKE
jgi:hypothetical protein